MIFTHMFPNSTKLVYDHKTNAGSELWRKCWIKSCHPSSISPLPEWAPFKLQGEFSQTTYMNYTPISIRVWEPRLENTDLFMNDKYTLVIYDHQI